MGRTASTKAKLNPAVSIGVLLLVALTILYLVTPPLSAQSLALRTMTAVHQKGSNHLGKIEALNSGTANSSESKAWSTGEARLRDESSATQSSNPGTPLERRHITETPGRSKDIGGLLVPRHHSGQSGEFNGSKSYSFPPTSPLGSWLELDSGLGIGSGLGPSPSGLPPLHQNDSHACSFEEKRNQAATFSRELEKRKSRWSLGCPEPVKLERYLAANWHTGRNLTFVNIGANKGYNLVRWMAYWAPQYGVDPSTWGLKYLHARYYENFLSWSLCGACRDCMSPPVKRWLLPTTDWRRKAAEETTPGGPDVPRILAMEPSASTFELLKQLQTWSKYPRLELFHLAASNYSGTGAFPNTKPGDEVQFLQLGAQEGQVSPVRVVTVDEFFLEQGIQRVHIMKIDTEGFDPLVLQGATRSLRAGLISVLEFEYHEFNHWQSTQLADVVHWLDGLGFECFLKLWEELGGYLRLTKCFTRELEFHMWSNVVCVHRKERHLALFMLDHCIHL